MAQKTKKKKELPENVIIQGFSLQIPEEALEQLVQSMLKEEGISLEDEDSSES